MATRQRIHPFYKLGAYEYWLKHPELDYGDFYLNPSSDSDDSDSGWVSSGRTRPNMTDALPSSVASNAKGKNAASKATSSNVRGKKDDSCGRSASTVPSMASNANNSSKGKGKAALESSKDRSTDHQSTDAVAKQDRVCGICFDPFTLQPHASAASTSKSTLFGIFLGCGHGFCHGCIVKHVQVQIKTAGTVFPPTCPEHRCESTIKKYQVESFISVTDHQQWTLRERVSTIKNKVYCPRKRCSALHDGDTLASDYWGASSCSTCGQRFCRNCKVVFHEGLRCAQYQALPINERELEDRKTLQLAETKQWRRCPSCRVIVELEHGCNHITCPCGEHFCYKCGSKWDKVGQKCATGRCDLWDDAMLLEERFRRQMDLDHVGNGHGNAANIPRQPVQNRMQQQPAGQIVANNDTLGARREQNEPILIRTGLAILCQEPRAPKNPPPAAPQPKVAPFHRGLDIGAIEWNMSRSAKRKATPWFRDMLTTATCEYCGVEFRAVGDLWKHLNQTTRHDVPVCCDIMFRSNQAKESHIDAVHKNLNNAIDRNLDIEEIENNMQGRDWFAYMLYYCQCHYCDRQFISNNALWRHLNTTQAHDVPTCCDLLFSNDIHKQHHHKAAHAPLNRGLDAGEVTWHMGSSGRRIGPPRWFQTMLDTFTCEYCDVRFASSHALWSHLNSTRDHDVPNCCGLMFKNMDAMYQHQEYSNRCPVRYDVY